MASIFDQPAFNQSLFHPREDASRCPANATDLWVFPGDVTLHVRWHHSLADAPTVLLFHGNGEVVADYDGYARTYAKAGANLAVVDFRGYGLSTGEPSLRGIIDDATHVLDTVRKAVTGRLFVMGRSLGSVCAAELYGRNDSGVAGFIYESGITDLAALLRRRNLTPPAAFSSDDAYFDPLPKLRRGGSPLLVLHGANDTLIHPSEGRAAFDAAGTPRKELVLIEGRGHNDLSFENTYWEAISRLVRA